jgi:Kef-type K+ transport system membrane component KefB
VSLAGRLAGFRGLDLINLSLTTNARGGPGIVLASVAFDAGIISSAFYTTLVLTAIFTSQMAGAWLDFVLQKGWPLLRENDRLIATEEANRIEPVRKTLTVAH